MKKSYVKLIILIEIIGVIVQGVSFYEAFTIHPTEIERPSAEQKKEDVSLRVSEGDNHTEVEISVMPQRLSEKEEEEALDRAEKEIEDSFLGKNDSFDRVWRSVDIRSEYVNDMVEADWDFTPGIVSVTGDIDHSAFTGSETVTATCVLSINDKKREYSFPFVAVEPDVNTPEGFMAALEEILSDNNEENTGEKMQLPTELSGKKLIWQRPVEYTGLWLCLLGMVSAVAIKLGMSADEKKEAEKKREEYGRQYPDIVENLILYVGAGISTRGAFEKMEGQYLRWKKRHPGKRKSAYENLILMNRALRDGCLEAEAYAAFGKSCMHPSYRKLAVLLKQNLKHGNDRLLDQLSHEEQMVKDMRTREIKSAGELISTKLLLPMGGLLGMILIVLIVPALQTISL